MYTQKTANIFDHIQDHSRLGLENKFLENKSGRIFLRSTGLLYKFLPTNLGVCKPTFYTFYTSHLRWNSTYYFTQSKQLSRWYINFPHELTCQFLTNHSIKIGRTAWPTRDHGKERSSPPVFFKKTGWIFAYEVSLISYESLEKNKLEPAIIWNW